MAMSFQDAAEKANISFQFGEIFHYNDVYYGKAGSFESVTKEEFIPGKFGRYIDNGGSQCVILLRNELHDKANAFVHYTYEKQQRNLVLIDIQGVGYSLCDPEIASKENKTDSEEHCFCFDIFLERAILNFTETHICIRFSMTKHRVENYNSAVFTQVMVRLNLIFWEHLFVDSVYFKTFKFFILTY